MNIFTEFKHNKLIISLQNEKDNFVLLEHQLAPHSRPYIHPLRSIGSDKVLTQDKPEHHPWQHGLYFGMHQVNDSDFWFDEGMRKNAGSFRDTQLINHSAQSNQATWNIQTTWIHHNGDKLFSDKQSWHLEIENDTYCLKVTWELTALTKINISQHNYGGIFLRMPWEKEMEAQALNDQQQKNSATEQQRAKWVDVTLALEKNDSKWGITLFDDPSNEGYPNYWRVDGNFGIGPSPVIPKNLLFDKGQAKSYTYHILPHTGEPDTNLINKKSNSIQLEGVFNG